MQNASNSFKAYTRTILHNIQIPKTSIFVGKVALGRSELGMWWKDLLLPKRLRTFRHLNLLP